MPTTSSLVHKNLCLNRHAVPFFTCQSTPEDSAEDMKSSTVNSGPELVSPESCTKQDLFLLNPTPQLISKRLEASQKIHFYLLSYITEMLNLSISASILTGVVARDLGAHSSFYIHRRATHLACMKTYTLSFT